ncbi:MAG: MerC domain-containing protein [Idiomarina sp.]|nr:MerC domain-containing protein [Idiomarina sp.]
MPQLRASKDKIGMFLSGLCLGHCLLTPIAMLIFGSGAILGWFASEWVHVALYLPVVLLVAISIVPNCVHLKAYRLLTLSLAGLLLMTISFGFHGAAEVVLSVGGASCVFAAHFINLRTRKQCAAPSKL